MALLTEKAAEDYFDLPISLPAMEIEGGDWLIVSFVRLGAGNTAKARMLQLHIEPESDGVGTVTCGIYTGFDPSRAPWLQDAKWVQGQPPLSLPTPYQCAVSSIVRDLYIPIQMLTPAIHTVVLGFQGTGTARVTVSGQMRFSTNVVVRTKAGRVTPLLTPPDPIPAPPPPPSPPIVTSITPNNGTAAGGTPVTITGSHFNDAYGVFAGAPMTSLVVVNDNTITAVTGAHSAATVDVVITTPIGVGTGIALYTFTAAPADLVLVSPGGGPLLTEGGDSISF